MTDQKITTSQDILDQHYEEVERLHKLIVAIALATDGQEAREIALRELGWSSVPECTNLANAEKE